MSILDPVSDPARSARVLRFTHGDVTWRLSLPRSADELIDEARFWADERLPYWADLWPAARALARYFIDHPPWAILPATQPRRIIEIGCGGVALASLSLARQGFDVLATDYENDALESVRSNCLVNGIGARSFDDALPARSCADSSRPQSAIEMRLCTRMIDWRDLPADLGVFDLVFAADVMYEQRHALSLAQAIPALVAPTGRFVLADPSRRYLPDFQQRLQERGWRDQDLAIIDEPQDDAGKPPTRVRIIEFAPHAASRTTAACD